jgi:hypothetical protein
MPLEGNPQETRRTLRSAACTISAEVAVPSICLFGLLAVLSLAIAGAAACDGTTQPSPKPAVNTPKPTPAPLPRTIVTGTVFQRTSSGRAPLPFGTVNAVSTTTGTELGRVTAAADGSFSISGIDTDLDPIFVFGGFGGFRQPCAAPATVGGIRDIDVVIDPALSGANLPMDLTTPVTVSGTVSETLSGTQQPAAFAFVAVFYGRPDIDDAGWYVAETLTDANGAYELCGLPSGMYTVQAGLAALFGEAPVTIGSTPATVDILLAPLTSSLTADRRFGALLVTPPRRRR